MLIVINGTRLTGIDQKLGHGVERYAGYPRYCPHRRTFAEHLEDGCAFGDRELVHREDYASHFLSDQA
jgi:hypothetical protein